MGGVWFSSVDEDIDEIFSDKERCSVCGNDHVEETCKVCGAKFCTSCYDVCVMCAGVKCRSCACNCEEE